MIQETTVTLRKQTPTAPAEWLYQSTFETRSRDITNEDGTTETITEEVEVRQFVKSVYLGANADPWSECTDEEKVAWEQAHQEATEVPTATTAVVEPNGDMPAEALRAEEGVEV